MSQSPQTYFIDWINMKLELFSGLQTLFPLRLLEQIKSKIGTYLCLYMVSALCHVILVTVHRQAGV